ncbi:hypothetical protein [Evtepia sp.]|uniref:hypothetical protein n=1 Tax=Evtepia sp. TaxID=2773933 RepID=UPI002A818B78|nr:hypothetical protein [Evtepia sp.]MDY4429632.1 hypothetical protein [Evtepia sp.]
MNINELLRKAATCKLPVTSSSGKGKNSFTIVNNRNGKRLTISSSLAHALDVQNEVFLHLNPDDQEILLAKEDLANENAVRLKLRGDQKKTAYDSRVVQGISDLFGLDYSNCSSKSFSKIQMDHCNEVPVAIVDMTSGSAMKDNVQQTEGGVS